jgi:hypothetical protein
VHILQGVVEINQDINDKRLFMGYPTTVDYETADFALARMDFHLRTRKAQRFLFIGENCRVGMSRRGELIRNLASLHN